MPSRQLKLAVAAASLVLPPVSLEQPAPAEPRLDGQQARSAFHVAMNYQGREDETQLLSGWVDAVLAQVPPSGVAWEKGALTGYLSDLMLGEVKDLENYTFADVLANAGTLDFQCERLRQNTPMNVVDGMWANAFVPDAVPKAYTLIVDKIRFEEQGEGALDKNHPYMWMRTVTGIGYSFPPVESSAFAHSQEFDDLAFWNAALTAAVGRLRNRTAETLGMIAFLEMRSSAPCHKQAQHMKWHGLDFSYYRLHRSIDNPHSGHGAQILEAIDAFLSEAGNQEELAQRAELVYKGYHAFEYTIDAVDRAVDQRLPRGGCPSAASAGGSCGGKPGLQGVLHREACGRTGPGGAGGAIAVTRAMEEFVSRHEFAHVFHRSPSRELLRQPKDMVQYVRSRCDLFGSGAVEDTRFLRLFEHGGPMYGVGGSEDKETLRAFASLSQAACAALGQ